MWDRPGPRAVVALAVAIGLGVWQGPRVLTAARAGSMQTVEGVVTEAAQAGSSLRSNRRIHRVYLTYSYEVGGGAYTGDRVTLFDNQFATHDQATTFAERYPQGAAVTVHYDPAAPDRACLVRPAGWAAGGGLIWVIGAGVALCVAGYSALQAWQESRWQRT